MSETVLPVRVKSRGDTLQVGDKERAISKDRYGFTRCIVYATPDSIMKCAAANPPDQRTIAEMFDTDRLGFDTYEEELNSRYGRNALQILLQDGPGTYDDVRDHIEDNPFLHAAAREISVFEANEELDMKHKVPVKKDDGDFTLIPSRWREPPLVAATAYVDGEFVEGDLREFYPTIKWVVEHWTDLGGKRSHVRNIGVKSEDVHTVEDIQKKSNGDMLDSVINIGDRRVTIHHVRDIEESIVDDEQDRLVMYCGTGFSINNNLIRLNIDSDRIQKDFHCKSCRKIAS